MQHSLFEDPIAAKLNADGYLSLTGTVVGVDEVGRGPLIGDVVTSAVILPSDCQLPLRDSKKLSEAKRQVLSEQIKAQALAYSICHATPAEIDQLNILQATMLAMSRAIEAVYQQCQAKQIEIERVYIDGNRCPSLNGLALPCEAVVKGDDKVMEISAASILAKVHRDQQMLDLDARYPQYGFAKHKGYPTAEHLANLKKYGLIDGYRQSFKPVKALLLPESN